tara:strand:+ start:399 stop:518 length:120 start_codon:yes stop_codon:yes gene_type:complete
MKFIKYYFFYGIRNLVNKILGKYKKELVYSEKDSYWEKA